MLGTIVNAAAIMLGGLIGCFLRKGLPERIRNVLTTGMGLCVVLIGIRGAIKTESEMLVILSIVLGGLLGAAIQIEKGLDRLGEKLQNRFAKGENDSFGKGFVTATLVFCVGAMAIVGSMDSGLRGDHATLLAKSVLDGVSSVIFASMLGPGVMLSAVSVFLYQGAITVLATVVSPLLTERVINEMGAVGGLLVIGIGLNMIRKEHIPVGDLLPAIFLPLLLTRIM